VLDGNRVFVLEGGQLSERDIEVGVTNWEHTEVLAGLVAGDQVVVSVDRRGVEPGALAQAEEPD
jgi:HlyD family secretion protein